MFLNMPMSSNNQRKDLTNASKRFKAMLSGLLHLMRYQEYEYIYIYIYIYSLVATAKKLYTFKDPYIHNLYL